MLSTANIALNLTPETWTTSAPLVTANTETPPSDEPLPAHSSLVFVPDSRLPLDLDRDSLREYVDAHAQRDESLSGLPLVGFLDATRPHGIFPSHPVRLLRSSGRRIGGHFQPKKNDHIDPAAQSHPRRDSGYSDCDRDDTGLAYLCSEFDHGLLAGPGRPGASGNCSQPCSAFPSPERGDPHHYDAARYATDRPGSLRLSDRFRRPGQKLFRRCGVARSLDNCGDADKEFGTTPTRTQENWSCEA